MIRRLLLLLLLVPTLALALTGAQLDALKTAITADVALAQLAATGAEVALAQELNKTAVPDFIVWQSGMAPDAMRDAVASGATQLDALTASKRDSLLWLVGGGLDARKASVRAALDDLTGNQQTLKAALVAVEKRTATRAEKILSTGTGTVASPATTTWEGQLSDVEVGLALRR